jgi:hypothetical protein
MQLLIKPPLSLGRSSSPSIGRQILPRRLVAGFLNRPSVSRPEVCRPNHMADVSRKSSSLSRQRPGGHLTAILAPGLYQVGQERFLNRTPRQSLRRGRRELYSAVDAIGHASLRFAQYNTCRLATRPLGGALRTMPLSSNSTAADPVGLLAIDPNVSKRPNDGRRLPIGSVPHTILTFW